MRNLSRIRMITIDALFIALLIIFTFVPYLGLISVGPISFTTIHIIVLIGALLFGYKRGTLYGFIFGLLTLIKALQYPGTLDYFAINPFISIVPRVLFGLISGLTFDFLRRILKPKAFNVVIYPVAGILTLIHTILYMTFFYIFGFNDLLGISGAMGLNAITEIYHEYATSFMLFIAAFITPGAACEIAGAIIIVPTIYLALNRALHLQEGYNKKEHKFKMETFNLISVTIISLIALFGVLLASVLI